MLFRAGDIVIPDAPELRNLKPMVNTIKFVLRTNLPTENSTTFEDTYSFATRGLLRLMMRSSILTGDITGRIVRAFFFSTAGGVLNVKCALHIKT